MGADRQVDMEYEFIANGKNYKVDVEKDDTGLQVDLDGHRESVDAAVVDRNTISLLVGERMVTVYVAFDGDKIYASVGGETFEIEETQSRSLTQVLGKRAGALEAETVISTPMPGQIVKVQVKEGDLVEPGQNLFIVESMKMENQIKSSTRARVDKVHFKDGDPVDANAPIVELSPVSD